MQTRLYSNLFKLVKSLAGVNAFTSEEQADIVRFINRRYFQAYNMSQNWVRYLIPSEKRFFQSKYYDITFNTTGNAQAPASQSATRRFYWIGMYGNSPVYWTIDQEVNGDSNSRYILFKDPITFNGDFILAKGRIGSNIDIPNPASNSVTPITSTILYQSVDVTDDDGIVDVTKEVPYAHLATWEDNNLSGTPVEGNLVFKSYDMFIPYYQPSFDRATERNTIGEFLRIHRKEALKNNSSYEYNFYVNEAGANILNIANTSDNHAYVTYKKIFEKFTTSTTTSVVASQPLTSTEAVPEEFFAFIAHSAYADFLRMDGQHQKAIVEEGVAQDALDLQLERNDIISNSNNATRKFSTYINRQSR